MVIMESLGLPNAQVSLIFPLFYFVWWDKIITSSALHKIQFMCEDLFWRVICDSSLIEM